MSAAPMRSRPMTPGRAPGLPMPASAPQHREAPQRREHLRAVSAPTQERSLVAFAALCVTIVVAALASVLLLNTAMAGGSYDAQEMRRQTAEAHQARATLLVELESASAPGDLAAAASELGMVPAPTIGFISLESATVLEAGDG